MIRVRPAGRVSVCSKDFNASIFSDTVKLFMMVVLIVLYSFIPLSVTLIGFQGHSSVKQFLKILYCYPIKLKLCTIVDHVK